jgi:hypothetical protein
MMTKHNLPRAAGSLRNEADRKDADKLSRLLTRGVEP